MTRDGTIALSSWKEKIMIEFMWTVVLGNMFMFAMVIFIIGFMFVLRVMLNVWFDTDFFKSVANWFKKADERIEEKHRIKMEREKIRLAESRATWVIGEDEDVPEQK